MDLASQQDELLSIEDNIRANTLLSSSLMRLASSLEQRASSMAYMATDPVVARNAQEQAERARDAYMEAAGRQVAKLDIPQNDSLSLQLFFSLYCHN